MSRTEGKCSSWKGDIPRGPAALSEPQNPHWGLLWWVLPPLLAPSQERVSPQDLPAPAAGLVSAEPALGW